MRLDLGAVSLENPPAFYHVDRVQIENIGKKQGGVPLEELMMIVTISLVSAAIEAAPANIAAAIISAIVAGVNGFQGFAALNYEGLQLDLGEGLSEVSKLVDRVTKTTADAVSPELASATLYSALDTAEDMGDVMAGAVTDASSAWGEALGSRKKPTTMHDVANAVNGTAAAIGNAWAEMEERARADGEIGKTVSQVLNTTVALKH